LSERFRADPDEAIAGLHRTAVAGKSDPELLFALAEMVFHRAEGTGKQGDFLSALVYAYAFLFPDDAERRPSGFDPRFRTACDIYNRSLTWAFASADRSRVELRSGRFALPSGSIEVTFDPTGAYWGDQALFHFVPADEFGIQGLQRYRPAWHRRVAGRRRRPASRGERVPGRTGIEGPRHGNCFGWMGPVAIWRRDACAATVEVHPAFEPGDVMIGGQAGPARGRHDDGVRLQPERSEGVGERAGRVLRR